MPLSPRREMTIPPPSPTYPLPRAREMTRTPSRASPKVASEKIVHRRCTVEHSKLKKDVMKTILIRPCLVYLFLVHFDNVFLRIYFIGPDCL